MPLPMPMRAKHTTSNVYEVLNGAPSGAEDDNHGAIASIESSNEVQMNELGTKLDFTERCELHKQWTGPKETVPHTRVSNGDSIRPENHERLSKGGSRGRSPYVPSRGPATRNGVQCSSIRRGHIVIARDVRRYWGTDQKSGEDGIEQGLGGKPWMSNDRRFLIKDHYPNHADVRAICTHESHGLKHKSVELKRQSMYFKPQHAADWVNEASPNPVLEVKWIKEGDTLSSYASIDVTEGLTKDTNEEFWVVKEVEEESMDKMDALEETLKQESRTW